MRTEEIGEILNISLSAGAAAVSELVDKEVKIAVNKVDEILAGSISLSDYEPATCFEFELSESLSGKGLLLVRTTDLALLVGAVLQKEFTREFELDEINKTTAMQLAGDFLGESFSALSNFANMKVSATTNDIFSVPETEPLIKEYYNTDQNLCAIKFGIVVNGIVDSEFVIILNDNQADSLVGTFNSGLVSNEPEAPQDNQNQDDYVSTAGPSYDIRPVELQRYSEPDQENAEQSSNLNMIMNVPLQITVEIGRSKKTIKDILELTTGSIVELNKQAGSRVDVFVNGQPIASGEVVVVDDYYGVRISEILNSGEIMKIL